MEDAMSHISAAEIILMVTVVVIFVIVFQVIPYWWIFRKAGFHPALSLLTLIPIVNIAVIYFLAFTEWPSLRQRQQTKELATPTS